MNKCQCPIEGNVPLNHQYMYSEAEKSGMDHKPGKCKGTNDIKLYKRGTKKLYLCSCCRLIGDVEVKNE